MDEWWILMVAAALVVAGLDVRRHEQAERHYWGEIRRSALERALRKMARPDWRAALRRLVRR